MSSTSRPVAPGANSASELWQEVQLAEVEFVHASGCSLGTPYGSCRPACDWRVVRLLGRELRPRANS
jgi:hypothetical protein